MLQTASWNVLLKKDSEWKIVQYYFKGHDEYNMSELILIILKNSNKGDWHVLNIVHS